VLEAAPPLPPQAASRPAAPTAPVTFRKSRREIALLIVVLLLINQKTSSGPYCTRLVVYKYDNKRNGKKKDVN
jgi:ribosomal protein L35AE/L33A